MEFTFPVHIPVVPMTGDPIQVEDKNVAVRGEFSRLRVGKNRFVVEAEDGNVYEVDVAFAGNGQRGSQRWKAARLVSRSEFDGLGRSPAP